MIKLKQQNKSINTTGSGDISKDVKNLSDLIETLYNKLNFLQSDYESYKIEVAKKFETLGVK